jgi:hypothetical protein
MSPYTDRIVHWGKRFARPRFHVYQPADKGLRVGLNKYGTTVGREGVVIGVYAVVFGRCWSLTWAKPVSRVEEIRS